MVLILITSGCTKFKKTTSVTEQTQAVAECPSCAKEFKTQCDVEKAKAEESPTHEIDIAEEKCLEGKYRTVDMRKCSYDAMDAWFLLIDKDMDILKKKLSAEKYQTLIKSQKDWKQYQESEFASINKSVFDKDGTMYQVISTGMKSDIVKERALLLDEYVHLYSEQY